ncbi:MAG: hypothetical protein Q8M95_15655 [Candidatus Methanoperedens sp.]|nr:hypothetical protein [Candidatus Methanoperedens sp.]
MNKIRIVIIVAAVILVTVFSGIFEPRKSIFTEKLGDMTLIRYETGEAAAQQISNMFALKTIPLGKGYSAMYRGSKGTMRIWVSEPNDHNVANAAFTGMNSALGGPTGGQSGHENSGEAEQTDNLNWNVDVGITNESFTKPEIVHIFEFETPSVYVMTVNNSINYYYFKMNYNTGRVYWIIFDSPDADDQISIVKQAVMKI